jgi:2'-5' RNA ligase
MLMDNGARPVQSRRLFYALWPDDATRDALMHIQVPLQGRKTRRENLHLTLAFLGRQPADLMPTLKEILRRIQQTPISLVLNRIGYFPQQRVAWAGTGKSSVSLMEMQKKLMQNLAINEIGINTAEEFRPHITLARDAPAPGIVTFAPIAWCADRVALIESVTHADGAIYRVIASHRLAGSV